MAVLGTPAKVCGRHVKALSTREHESVQYETILKKNFDIIKRAQM